MPTNNWQQRRHNSIVAKGGFWENHKQWETEQEKTTYYDEYIHGIDNKTGNLSLFVLVYIHFASRLQDKVME